MRLSSHDPLLVLHLSTLACGSMSFAQLCAVRSARPQLYCALCWACSFVSTLGSLNVQERVECQHASLSAELLVRGRRPCVFMPCARAVDWGAWATAALGNAP
jgi:hypothetical protein